MVKEKDQVSAAINMVSKKHDKDEATISRMQTRSMTSVMPWILRAGPKDPLNT